MRFGKKETKNSFEVFDKYTDAEIMETASRAFTAFSKLTDDLRALYKANQALGDDFKQLVSEHWSAAFRWGMTATMFGADVKGIENKIFDIAEKNPSMARVIELCKRGGIAAMLMEPANAASRDEKSRYPYSVKDVEGERH